MLYIDILFYFSLLISEAGQPSAELVIPVQ